MRKIYALEMQNENQPEKKCSKISPGEIIPEHTGSMSKRKLEMVVIKEALR